MTELPVEPHMAKLVIWWLLADEDVTDIFGQEIGTDLSNNQTWPALRVTQLPGGSDALGVVGRYLLQLDSFGGSRDTAHRGCAVAARSLKRMNDLIEFDERDVAAVVTDVNVGTVGDDSDKDFNPAKPRSSCTAVITATPLL